jgi:hypothetical protein
MNHVPTQRQVTRDLDRSLTGQDPIDQPGRDYVI